MANLLGRTLHRYRLQNSVEALAAIGDIHGRIDLLEQTTARLDAWAQRTAKPVVEIYLGDYVDRGGNPQAVLEFLCRRMERSVRRVVCLMGNHEHMMLASLHDDADFQRWVEQGGHATLASYGVASANVHVDPRARRFAFRDALPTSHLNLLRRCRRAYLQDGFYFVHAGVRPGVALARQAIEDQLWIREPFLSSTANYGPIIVHGHTPTAHPQFRRNRIGIDTGAYLTGNLTCLLIDENGAQTLS